MELQDKINGIYEQAEDFTGRDPFLEKIYEFQLKGVEFAEMNPWTRVGICTNKNDNQHEADPLVYHSVVMDEKKFRYFKLNHRNSDWGSNEAVEVTEEDFLNAVVPSETSANLDIRDQETTNEIPDNELIKNAEKL